MENLNKMIMNKHVIKNRRINPLLEDEEWKVQMIEEMCLAKLGFNETDIEDNDINTMLELVCTEWMESGVGVVVAWA